MTSGRVRTEPVPTAHASAVSTQAGGRLAAGDPSSGPDLQALLARYGSSAVASQLDALRRHGSVVEDPALWLETALRLDFKFMPIEPVERCPCGSGEHRLLSRFVYWNLLAHRQCAACGLVFVSPRLAPESMRRVFQEFYVSGDPPEYWGERRRPIFREVGGLLRRLGCTSVFDVGSAFGHFLEWTERYGLQAEGCEISTDAVRWGRENLGVRLHAGTLADLPLRPGSYSAVTSLDTLYYVPDLIPELARYRELLRPGGHLVLRLRNGLFTALRARAEGLRRVGRPALPMPHLWAFTPATAARLLKEAGFEIEAVVPAAYSRTRLAPAQALLHGGNRALRRAWHGFPILTRSFYVLGRRPMNDLDQGGATWLR